MFFRPERKEVLKQSKKSKCFKGVSPWFRQKIVIFICVFFGQIKPEKMVCERRSSKWQVIYQNFDFQRAFQPYEILVYSGPKFKIWQLPSWRNPSSLVMST